MTTLTYSTPFDILVKNFFDADSTFDVIRSTKPPHPVDIYETADGLFFEVACTGLTKQDVEISIHHDILKISYSKDPETVSDRQFILKSIARRSFNLGWKISNRFDINRTKANMQNGLLTIHVPFAIESKPKTLSID